MPACQVTKQKLFTMDNALVEGLDGGCPAGSKVLHDWRCLLWAVSWNGTAVGNAVGFCRALSRRHKADEICEVMGQDLLHIDICASRKLVLFTCTTCSSMLRDTQDVKLTELTDLARDHGLQGAWLRPYRGITSNSLMVSAPLAPKGAVGGGGEVPAACAMWPPLLAASRSICTPNKFTLDRLAGCSQRHAQERAFLPSCNCAPQYTLYLPCIQFQ